jgi:hypothetical protein
MTGSMKYALILGLLLATVGCLDRTGTTVDEAVTILKRSDQCRISEPTFRPLRGMADLRRVMPPSTMMSERQTALDIDFSTQTVMLLAMGQKPTAGFHIEIDNSGEGLQWQGGILRLPVRFTSPVGEVAATVVTSPCVIFLLGRDGVQRIIAGDTGLTFSF